MAVTASDGWHLYTLNRRGRYILRSTGAQQSYAVAQVIAGGYLVPDPDLPEDPEFQPDVRVLRDGSIVELLDAARELLAGTTDQADARARLAAAVLAAMDPEYDIDYQEQAMSLQRVAEATAQGRAAQEAGDGRETVPFEVGTTFYRAWMNGWSDAAAGE